MPRTDPHAATGPAPDAELTKTGTTTVAVSTPDSVVLAADRRASAGGRFVTSKDTQKVEAVHPTAAVTIAGAVGSLQDYTRRLTAESDRYAIRRGDPPSMHAFATFAGNLLRNGPYRAVQSTLGGVDADGSHVYDLDAGGAVLEAPYAANGSGTQFALGVLERDYRPDLSTDEARAVAARAVESAIERDTASGNGVTVAEVTADGVDFRTYDDPRDVRRELETDTDDASEEVA